MMDFGFPGNLGHPGIMATLLREISGVLQPLGQPLIMDAVLEMRICHMFFVLS